MHSEQVYTAEASSEAIAADGLTKSKILLKVRTGGSSEPGGMDPKLAAMIARRRAGIIPAH